MSFVVEIPTVFTKPTQIPARLGNTILTGNETIEGSLYVNGSLTLNNGNEGDSTNVVNYDSLDISNNLNVNGLTTLNEVNASSITTNNLVVNESLNINSNVDISGTITLPIIGDVKTSIQGNTDNILSNTNNLSSIQTQVDALINFTGGGVNFRAYTLSSATQSSGQNLNYNIIDYDTENSYDASDNIYTIVIGGTYVFTLGWSSITDSTAVINLIRKRNSVETILQQSTNGENTTNNNSFFLTTIAECETDDEIYAYLDSGTCRIVPYNPAAPNTITSFSGSRISN
jgi:hypothetical protein